MKMRGMSSEPSESSRPKPEPILSKPIQQRAQFSLPSRPEPLMLPSEAKSLFSPVELGASRRDEVVTKGEKGERGEKGEQGERGEKGEQGEKGEKGDSVCEKWISSYREYKVVGITDLLIFPCSKSLVPSKLVTYTNQECEIDFFCLETRSSLGSVTVQKGYSEIPLSFEMPNDNVGIKLFGKPVCDDETCHIVDLYALEILLVKKDVPLSL